MTESVPQSDGDYPGDDGIAEFARSEPLRMAGSRDGEEGTSQDDRARLLAREHDARVQAEEARRRFAFLAEAGEVLASSLDYETTLAAVAHLAVSQIADWCAIQMVELDGSVRSIVTAHLDPAKVELARELGDRYPFDPGAATGAAQVLRTGQSELIPYIADELLTSLIPDKDLLRIMRGLGLHSSMIVPLRARGRIMGVITFISAESGRHYDVADLRLAEALGSRAGLAVDNARLHGESLRVAAEQAAILARIADGVLMIDPAGRIAFANDAAYRILGIAPQMPSDALLEVILPLLDLVGDDGHRILEDELILARALQGEILTNVERTVRHPDGTEVVVQASAAPVIAEDGERLGAVSVFRDVTAYRQLERERETFLSSAAHDLKTPLTTVKAMAQVLQRRIRRHPTPDTEPLIDGLAKIDGTVTRMARLVNDLLDVSRVQTGEAIDLVRGQTDLVDLVRRVVSEMPQGHRIVVETELNVLPGFVDGDRLERVLTNLLSNAIKYSPDGGPVTVTLSSDDTPEGNWAEIIVRDHGMGIPEMDLPRIFERFYRGQNVQGRLPGTGIGLLGAKQIVEHHGGTITVSSVEDEGTVVVVRVPLRPGDGAA
jgi:PAS domain S-box-containing protein